MEPKTKKKLRMLFYCVAVGIMMFVSHNGFPSFSSTSKWDGTWSTSEGKIVVMLNSETMKADVKINLGDEPITYTSKWEYIDDGIVYFDYAPNQATIIKNDGSVYGYNTRTGQITDRGVKMHKRK